MSDKARINFISWFKRNMPEDLMPNLFAGLLVTITTIILIPIIVGLIGLTLGVILGIPTYIIFSVWEEVFHACL